MAHGFAKLSIKEMVAEIRAFRPNEDKWNEEVMEIDLKLMGEKCEVFDMLTKAFFDFVFEVDEKLSLDLREK